MQLLGSNKSVRFAEESQWAVAPSTSTGTTELRRVNSTLDVVKELYESKEINQEKQVKQSIHGLSNVSGKIESELVAGAFTTLIKNAIASEFDLNLYVQSLSLKIESGVIENTYKITRQSGSWSTDGFKNLMTVQLDGANLASGNKFNNLFISSVSDLELIVYVLNDSLLTEYTSFVSDCIVFTAGSISYAKKQGQVDKSIVFEEAYLDANIYELYTGNKVQEVQIQTDVTSSYPRVTFNIVGCDLVRKGNTPYFTSVTKNNRKGLHAVSSKVFLDGIQLGFVSGMQISVKRNLGLNNAVGVKTPIDITEGMVYVSGNFTAYFTDYSVKQRFNTETFSSLAFVFLESKYKGCDLVSAIIPRISIKSVSKNDNPSGLYDTFEFYAVLNKEETNSLTSMIGFQDSSVSYDIPEPPSPPPVVLPFFEIGSNQTYLVSDLGFDINSSESYNTVDIGFEIGSNQPYVVTTLSLEIGSTQDYSLDIPLFFSISSLQEYNRCTLNMEVGSTQEYTTTDLGFEIGSNQSYVTTQLGVEIGSTQV